MLFKDPGLCCWLDKKAPATMTTARQSVCSNAGTHNTHTSFHTQFGSSEISVPSLAQLGESRQDFRTQFGSSEDSSEGSSGLGHGTMYIYKGFCVSVCVVTDMTTEKGWTRARPKV